MNRPNKTLIKSKKNGTCYEDVYKYYIDENELPEAILVHGILHGRGELEGYIYGHAWVELGDVVLQPVKQNSDGKTYGLAFVARKENFYALYKVDEKKLVKYCGKEAVLNEAIKFGHFGPWHDLGLGKDGFIYEPQNI